MKLTIESTEKLTHMDGVPVRDSRVLRWGTHAPPGETIDAYTTLAWGTVCRAVASVMLTRPGSGRTSTDVREP